MIEKLYDLTGANHHYWLGGRNHYQEYPGGDYEPSHSWTYRLQLKKRRPVPKDGYYLVYKDGTVHKFLLTYSITLDVTGRRGKGSRVRPVMGYVTVRRGELSTPSFQVKGKSLAEMLRKALKSKELTDHIEAIQRSLYNPLGCRAVYKLSEDRQTWEPYASDLGALYWYERFRDFPRGEYLELKWGGNKPSKEDPRSEKFLAYHTTSRGGGSLMGGGLSKEDFPPVPSDVWIPSGFSPPIV